MKPASTLIRFVCPAILLALSAAAQETSVVVNRPRAPFVVRPYQAAQTPPIRLTNSPRLRDLIRGGKLYLTVQDAIALAIEDNLDLEVDRYGPLIQEWNVERAEGGGALRGVTSGSSQIGQVASGQGVVGSERSAGLAVTQSNGTNNSLGATVTQIGAVTPNLDPVLYNTSLWSHTTYPQANTVVSQTTALVDTAHIFNTSVQAGLITGGYVQAAFYESYLKENAPSNILNPSVAPRLQVYIQHNFLQGFGVGVNSRFIRVARKNQSAAQYTFQSQLLNVVSTVLNLYWDLVSDTDDLKARQGALNLAQKFYDDTKIEIHAGALSRVDIYAAEREVANRKRELTLAETTQRQQENLLKQSLVRDGMDDPQIDAAEIVPLDRLQVPETDDLPPLRSLVASAAAKRPDLQVTNINSETAELSGLGTANGLLPPLVGFASSYNSGLAGQVNPESSLAPDPNFVGGLGKATGQVFRRDFPTNRGGGFIQIPLKNRLAQGDYGIDQLQLKQGELVTRRGLNQLVVDIASQIVALRQARARYTTAVDSRILQQQLFDKVKQNFSLGGAKLTDLIIAQRSLSNSQTAEVTALSAYSHARVALDQVLGVTLEKNNISVQEALQGRVSFKSEPRP